MGGGYSVSVYRYDEAIIDKFRDIFDDNRIHILPVENAIRFTAQLQKDDVKFPLISTTRLGWSIRSSDVNFAAKMTGGLHHRENNNTNVFAQIIPIRIEYQLDIFTVDRQSGDELTRELVFYFYQHPTLTVRFPYMLNGEHHFNLYLDNDVVDNSETIEHVNKGVMFRNTLTFYTDDANLFAGDVQLQGKVISDVEDLNTLKSKED